MKRCETRKLPNGILVRRGQIIGTDVVIHAAYEPTLTTAAHCDGIVLAHSTVTRFDGEKGWHGRIGTRRLTKEIDQMPADEVRIARCREYREMQNNIAADAIIQAFPYCNFHSCHDGEIVTSVQEVERAEAKAA